MRFGVLGLTRVSYPDGREALLGGARRRALLAMLMLDPGRVVAVERLIDGLYGDRPPAGAANALQSQVSRIRQTLPGLVDFHRGGYRLAAEPDDVDALRFARLAEQGRRALAAGNPAQAAGVLRDALSLWRGEPLADVREAPFAGPQATRLTELRRAAREDAIEAELGLGRPAPVLAELHELVSAQPLRERPYALLMRALTATGQSAEALAVYATARRVLAEELGTDPSPELSVLHVAVLRGAAPSGSEAPSRYGLPSQLTSFVGREDELRRVDKALVVARLVTLHGPGGAGKTRLAAEIAARYADDVCFVELAPLGAGDLPQAVLTALGLRDSGLRDATPRDSGRPEQVTERLVAALATRQLLLVLDNCEHLVDPAAALAGRLLAACPRLRVLATSREPLGVTGEVRCPVPGLPVPPTGSDDVDPMDFAAVRLLADRVADVTPGFAVTPDNTEAVLRICRALDGLPLAIELAAARLHALPVAEVAARLDDRLRLLSRGSRTVQTRHQTLRSMVEWSWDLLDEPERALARRLTVFAGGSTLAAIERVCGLDGRDIVDALTGLVEKSLIGRDGGRYRMLETVRAFCAERLAVAGEEQRLRQAHAAYFLELAGTADPHLRRAEQLEWLGRLDADRDNLHAALRRSTADGDLDTALRLVAALSFYWWLRGLRSEAAVRSGELLRQVGDDPPPGRTEEYVLCALNAAVGGNGGTKSRRRWAGYPTSMTGLPLQPFVYYLSAIALGPPADDPAEVQRLQQVWRARLGADPWSAALGAIGGGWITLLAGGGVAQAEPDFAAALSGFRALGERWGMVLALSGMAEMATWHGDHAGAIAPMDEALRLAGELGSAVDMADLLRSRADGRLRAGDLSGADADYQRAATLAQQAGAAELVAATRLGLGELAWLRDDLAAARRMCTAALEDCPTGWYSADAIRMEILAQLGRIAEAQDDPEAAQDWYRRVCTVEAGVLGFQATANAVDGLAGLAVRDGDGERAALLLGAAHTITPLPGSAGDRAKSGLATAARGQIGTAAYEAAYARGAALSRGDALALLTGRT